MRWVNDLWHGIFQIGQVQDNLDTATRLCSKCVFLVVDLWYHHPPWALPPPTLSDLIEIDVLIGLYDYFVDRLEPRSVDLVCLPEMVFTGVKFRSSCVWEISKLTLKGNKRQKKQYRICFPQCEIYISLPRITQIRSHIPLLFQPRQTITLLRHSRIPRTSLLFLLPTWRNPSCDDSERNGRRVVWKGRSGRSQ